jgi:glycosyltransferase involved in cell wall biosynthesis
VKKKIGVFLTLPPEQLMNYYKLDSFVIGLLENISNEVGDLMIAGPESKRGLLEELFQRHPSNKKPKILTAKNNEILFGIYQFFSRAHNSTYYFSLLQKTKDSLKKCRDFFLAFFRNYKQAYKKNPVKHSLSLLPTSILFLPFLVVFGCLLIGWRFLLAINLHLKNRLPIEPLFYVEQAKRKICYKLQQMTLKKVHQGVYKKLVKIINQEQDFTHWFIINLYSKEIKKIQARKIIVLTECHLSPCGRGEKKYPEEATQIICYSPAIKNELEHIGIKEENIALLGSAGTDLMPYLQHKKEAKQPLTRAEVLQIIHRYQIEHLQKDPYLSNYDFNQMRFVLYPGQLHTHEYLLNLIKAYEICLRQRHLNIKLILIADLSTNSELHEYILRKRLQYDVLCMPEVSLPVFSALNYLALCTIEPSLFTAQFPSSFSEAYSVGTPSIMGAVPVIFEEIQDPLLQQAMLFAPDKVEDLVEKLAGAVMNPDLLYEKQHLTYQKLTKLDWLNHAKKHLQFFC